MSDILIHKPDTMSDYAALKYVQSVIASGRISQNGKCYTYVTEFSDGIIVYADKKKSDIFTVVQKPVMDAKKG